MGRLGKAWEGLAAPVVLLNLSTARAAAATQWSGPRWAYDGARLKLGREVSSWDFELISDRREYRYTVRHEQSRNSVVLIINGGYFNDASLFVHDSAGSRATFFAKHPCTCVP